jgi:hypothetical protein
VPVGQPPSQDELLEQPTPSKTHALEDGIDSSKRARKIRDRRGSLKSVRSEDETPEPQEKVVEPAAPPPRDHRFCASAVRSSVLLASSGTDHQ